MVNIKDIEKEALEYWMDLPIAGEGCGNMSSDQIEKANLRKTIRFALKRYKETGIIHCILHK